MTPRQMQECFEDFKKCADVALKADAFNPSLAKAFSGCVSERLARQVQEMQAEIMAWRERFPQYEYRRIDDCISFTWAEVQRQKGEPC